MIFALSFVAIFAVTGLLSFAAVLWAAALLVVAGLLGLAVVTVCLADDARRRIRGV